MTSIPTRKWHNTKDPQDNTKLLIKQAEGKRRQRFKSERVVMAEKRLQLPSFKESS